MTCFSTFLFSFLISFCIVGDYAQNLGVPHFGGEQPGDTYYYSPLSVYCFGVVDVCGEQDKLHAYMAIQKIREAKVATMSPPY